jgi:DNA-binding NtrC family response regulator
MTSISSLVNLILQDNINETIPKLKELSNDLEFRLLFSIDYSQPYKKAKSVFIRKYLQDLLVMSLGNVKRAAFVAKITRRHLHRLLLRHGISTEEIRKSSLKYSNYLQEQVQSIISQKIEYQAFSTKRKQDIYTNIHDITQLLANNLEDPIGFDAAMDIFDRTFIEKVMAASDHDVDRTAYVLQVSPRTLCRKMKKLKVNF